MVYSRVTTSAMAERVFLPVLTGADISAIAKKDMLESDSLDENNTVCKQVIGELSLTE